MGAELNSAQFVGIMDQNWRPVYATNNSTMALAARPEEVLASHAGC